MLHSLIELAQFSDPVHYFESLSYLGVFFAVALSGHLLPIPEDAIMLLTGYIAALGLVSLPHVIVVAVVAIVCADFILYYLVFTGARVAQKIESHIKTNLFSWYSERMRAHGFRFVFISRFIPGLRFIGPVVAGYIKMSPGTFILYTCCSAVVYVPASIMIGFFFHTHITPLLSAVESTRHVIFGTVLFVVSAMLAVWGYRRYFRGDVVPVPPLHSTQTGVDNDSRDIV